MGCTCSGDKQMTLDESLKREVDYLFQKYDQDLDNKLSLSEAKPYIIAINQKVHNLDEESAKRDDVVRELFNEIDTDRDNFISRDEMYNHLNRYKKQHDLRLESLQPMSRPG